MSRTPLEIADSIRVLAQEMLDISNSILTELHTQRKKEDMSLEEIIKDRIDVAEAAALLGVSTKTIYNKVKDGLIPHTKVDNSISFSKKELCKTFNIYHYDN